MSKIKILPEQVANQIAAGEVVERPASVVKEFVENAIDAGARQLGVEVEGGGTRLLRIVDDGEGMDEDDVLLCLERHATSKLASREQLAAIGTLGFRGEAVPSIASVARLTITSRREAAALGTRAEVHYGKVTKVHEMGCGRGTVMEVRDLFGNVPARRKFLKTNQTELSHIEEVVRSYALARPALGVSYIVNGREVLALPAGADSLEQRVKRLLAPRLQGPLIAVRAHDRELQLSGFLLPPEETTGSARLGLFVNGRAVRDRLLTHAVAEGLRNFVMKGRRPAGALFLEMPPAEVDVNVHPAKQEVRFRQAARVHQQVAAAVSGAMADHQQVLKRSVFTLPGEARDGDAIGAGGRPEPAPRHPSFVTNHGINHPGLANLPSGNQLQGAGEARHRPACTGVHEQADNTADSVDCDRLPSFPSLQVREPGTPPAATGGPPSAADSGEPVPAAPPAPPFREEATDPLPPESGPVDARGEAVSMPPPAVELPIGFRLMGQLLQAYLLCESGAGLVVIDQHAAHERLLFGQLQAQVDRRKVAAQSLLFPKMLTLGPEDIELLGRYGEEIARLGIELREFGGGSYVLKALPAMLAHLPPEEVLADILDRYRACDQEGRRSAAGRLESILATMACKAAIKAGQPLKEEEMTHLLQQMEDADVFSHCPHGRPVMKFFTKNDMKRWFRRT